MKNTIIKLYEDDYGKRNLRKDILLRKAREDYKIIVENDTSLDEAMDYFFEDEITSIAGTSAGNTPFYHINGEDTILLEYYIDDNNKEKQFIFEIKLEE